MTEFSGTHRVPEVQARNRKAVSPGFKLPISSSSFAWRLNVGGLKSAGFACGALHLQSGGALQSRNKRWFASGHRLSKLAKLVALGAAMLGCFVQTVPLSAAAAISYVQGNYATPQTPETTVTVPFTVAQAAGDLNVVVVGWNDTTATVSSVTDKSGNTYTLAVGPTAFSGYLSQSIYYAKNIESAGAGANAVTVTFSTAAAYPDIRILEYSGASSSSPVDVTAAGDGNSTTSASATATTTNAADLIFGANIVYTDTKGPGSGFTERILTPQDGDIAEDETVTAAGSYSATAPLTSSGPWVMQMVAFRAGSSTGESSTTQLLSASPSSLSFGDTTLGSTSILPVVVSNIGTGSVTISQATASGTGFSVSGPTLPFALGAGATTSFSVEFDPTAAASTTGSLSIASNATNSPTVVSLSGTGVNEQTVSLSWTASTSSAITGYNIFRATVSGGPYTQLNSAQVTGTTYTDTTVESGTTYYYVATAVNAEGVQSADSNQATAVVPSQ
jgi:Abnormal spindle-like microcephaly-assoc'd, ASPM-SPD-2-Hydin/Fibronectin type III domain